MRQGAQAGLLADAIAAAAGVPATAVRRALLLSGDLEDGRGRRADRRRGGARQRSGSRVGRPLAPMLAQAAASVDEALAATGAPAAVDAKLDGIRIQVHRDGDDVAVFSRSLDDITGRVPEIVAATRALPARTRRPRRRGARGRRRPAGPGRSRRRRAGPRRLAPGALTPFFFDALHLDGVDLVDEPGTVAVGRARRRGARLAAGRPDHGRLGRGGAGRVRRPPSTTARRAW